MSPFSLALERAKTAKSAVEIIGNLVETYGQGGACYDASSKMTSGYDNSFLVVDSEEAWTIETCDRVWVAKQIKGRTIDRLFFVDRESNVSFSSRGFLQYVQSVLDRR